MKFGPDGETVGFANKEAQGLTPLAIRLPETDVECMDAIRQTVAVNPEIKL
jgi:hypothetical protein